MDIMASRRIRILVKPQDSNTTSTLNAVVKGRKLVSIKGKVMRRYNARDRITDAVTVAIGDDLLTYEACPFYITTGNLPFMLSLNATTRHGTTSVMFTVDRNNETLFHVGQLATLIGYVDGQAPAAIRHITNPADWLTTAQLATRLDVDEDYTAALQQAAGAGAEFVSTDAFTTWLTRLSPTKPVGKLLLWWTVNNALRMAAPLMRLPFNTAEQQHAQTRTNIKAYNIALKAAMGPKYMKVTQWGHKDLYGCRNAKVFKKEYGVEDAHELNRLLQGPALTAKLLFCEGLAHIITHDKKLSPVPLDSRQGAAVEAAKHKLGPMLRATSAVFGLDNPAAMRSNGYVETVLPRAIKRQRIVDKKRRNGEVEPGQATTTTLALVHGVAAGLLPVAPVAPMLPANGQ